MERAAQEFERARGRMAGDFRTMIADSEDLLKAAAAVSGESFGAARAKFEEKLRRAKATLADASQPVIDKTRASAALADDYARGNPWTVAGAAIVAGILLGLLAARR
ncbi:MAG TPA: DUF883 family protein [Burkholderiales bacterium]|jgi:ElaB/YqjD/DUF883 family membrane-anchored ribosome-binding protein